LASVRIYLQTRRSNVSCGLINRSCGKLNRLACRDCVINGRLDIISHYRTVNWILSEGDEVLLETSVSAQTSGKKVASGLVEKPSISTPARWLDRVIRTGSGVQHVSRDRSRHTRGSSIGVQRVISNATVRAVGIRSSMRRCLGAPARVRQ
jgi:hypothetical protein